MIKHKTQIKLFHVNANLFDSQVTVNDWIKKEGIEPIDIKMQEYCGAIVIMVIYAA